MLLWIAAPSCKLLVRCAGQPKRLQDVYDEIRSEVVSHGQSEHFSTGQRPCLSVNAPSSRFRGFSLLPDPSSPGRGDPASNTNSQTGMSMTARTVAQPLDGETGHANTLPVILFFVFSLLHACFNFTLLSDTMADLMMASFAWACFSYCGNPEAGVLLARYWLNVVQTWFPLCLATQALPHPVRKSRILASIFFWAESSLRRSLS